MPRLIDVGDDTWDTFIYLGWLRADQVGDPKAEREALNRMAATFNEQNNPFLL